MPSAFNFIPWNAEAPTRTRRHEQLVASLLNSMIASGTIVQTGQNSWAITGVGSGGSSVPGLQGPPGPPGSVGLRTGVPPPPPTLGHEGDFYFQTSGVVWYKSSLFFGAPPTWRQVAKTMVGPPGPPGPAGVPGPPGIGVPGPPGATGAAGSGASTADSFVVGQGANADLTNPITITGLSGSPDKVAGGVHDQEFDTTWNSGGIPAPWSTFGTAFTASDFNSSRLSHARLQMASNAGSVFGGIIMAAPAIPYTMTAKLADSTVSKNNNGAFIFISDSSTAAGNSVVAGPQWSTSMTNTTVSSTNLSTASGLSGLATQGLGQMPMYIRAVVTTANSITYQCSFRGIAWITILSSNNFLSSATYCGLCVYPNNLITDTYWDWVRFN
jgi:hypothetical protein